MEERISKFIIAADISYTRMILAIKKNGKQMFRVKVMAYTGIYQLLKNTCTKL